MSCCNLNGYDYLWKVHHICYCIWGNAWFVSMERTSIFDLILGKRFYGFIALFAKFKDAFILTCDIWDNWYKIFLTRNELKALRILWIYWVWYFKGFCEITWNWIVFWFLVNYEFLMFLPLGCDMWLLGDYLTRYYSLCDIEFWLCVSELVPVLCR